MKILKKSVSELKFAPYNPRVMSDTEKEKLKQSLKSFNYVSPIVWNKQTGHVVGGNQRLQVLMELGYKEIEVVEVDLPIEKEKALNVALNKIHGEWDEDKLAVLLEELSTYPDFDVSLTGFDLPEVSQIIDEQNRLEEDNFDFYLALQSIKDSITKVGDIICLGEHKLMCGDSNNTDDLKKLMQDEKAQLIYTDPPYNVAYDNRVRPVKMKNKKQWTDIQSDNLNQTEYEEWLENIFINMGHFLDKGATAYVWNGHRQFYFMHKVLTELGYHISTVITWAKENFAGSFAPYNWQTEHCLFFWKKDNGPHIWYGDGRQSNLWYARRDHSSRLLHPTQKPTCLVQKAIKNSSKRSDIVLDMFLGSGSTLIGAASLDRRCFGMEIDPKYCDAIIRRYIAFVGKENVSEDILSRYCREVSHV